jgi:hypothetical protein
MEWLELFILAACFLTSVISGVLGMAGGMILMGLLTFVFPLEQAFILHGIVQFAANGQRFFQLRKFALIKQSLGYFAGAIAVYLALRGFDWAPKPSFVYLLMGLLALLPSLKSLPTASFLNVWTAGLAGVLVNGLQILCGVAGPMLDLFFRDNALNRFEVISTKALTQTMSHFLKIVFFVELGLHTNNGEPFKLALTAHWVAGCLLATFLGTLASKKLLTLMIDKSFFTATLRSLQILGIFYIGKSLIIMSDLM